MPTYAVQTLGGIAGPQKPQIGPLAGGKLAKRSRVSPVLRSQDKICALGRRVIAFQSTGGEHVWLTPDTNPDAATSTHPYPTTAREVLRARTDVTPGCFFRLSAVCVPSGQTQVLITAGDYDAGGATGTIRVTVAWHDQTGGTTTRTQEVAIPPSPLPLAAAPDDPWVAPVVVEIPLVAPVAIGAADDNATYTRCIAADIVVYHIGGVRCTDAVLEEVPHSISREHADATNLWTSHLFATPFPDGEPADGMSHPWQDWGDGDPRGGRLALDVANNQALRLGPQLISWTAWNEDDGSLTTTPLPSTTTTTSTTFVRLQDLAATTYSTSAPGWSIASGAYARRADECHPYWGDDGSIPVVVHVHGSQGDVGETGIVRIQASEWSWIDVEITDRDPAWYRAYGHLRCGIGPGDDSVVQGFFRKVSGVSAVNVHAISVHYAGQYTTAL